jgi:hypothetical protein
MRCRFAPAFFVFALIGAVICSACSSGSGGATGGGNTIAVTIATAGSTSVNVNGAIQFTDAVTGTSNTAVTWRVNGAANGDITTIGSIDGTGLYTAPAAPPSGGGTVAITAISNADNATVSNSITVTVTSPSGVQVSPQNPAVLAGNTQAFTATENGSTVTATWAVSSGLGGDIGSIDPNSGVYQAPLNIPPGQDVTITATAADGTATTVATIIFSAASFNGQYAMSFMGRDSKGLPLDVAGSFISTGAANTTTGTMAGVIDINQASGPVAACPMTGNFGVGPDGRSSATITCTPSGSGGPVTFNLRYTIINNQHSLLADFDVADTGTGTIDAQNTESFSADNITGIYVFSVNGIGVASNTVYAASAGGTFTAAPNGDGLSGAITTGSGVEDVVFPATSPALTKGDQTLGGSYSLDSSNLTYGRGTLTLTTSSANPMATITFGFYMVDATHMKMVEIDRADDFSLGGDLYAGPATTQFSDATLNGAFVFSVNGTSPHGPYGMAGLWNYNGAANGDVTGGEEDFNNGGLQFTTSGQTVTQTPYIVSPATGLAGQFDRFLVNIKDEKSRQYEYAIYLLAPAEGQTSSAGLMQEIDYDPQAIDGTGFGTGIVATGMTWPQASSSTLASGGGFAVSLSGTSIATGGNTSQSVLGAILLSRTNTAIIGKIDVDKPAGAGLSVTSINLSNTSAFTIPDVLGRGTATLVTNTTGATTFTLVYYLVDDNTAIILDTEGSRSATGVIARQF